jgi:hypothetical protein
MGASADLRPLLLGTRFHKPNGVQDLTSALKPAIDVNMRTQCIDNEVPFSRCAMTERRFAFVREALPIF